MGRIFGTTLCAFEKRSQRDPDSSEGDCNPHRRAKAVDEDVRRRVDAGPVEDCRQDGDAEKSLASIPTDRSTRERLEANR